MSCLWELIFLFSPFLSFHNLFFLPLSNVPPFYRDVWFVPVLWLTSFWIVSTTFLSSFRLWVMRFLSLLISSLTTLSANLALKSLPNLPNLSSLVPTRYLSNPPNFFTVLMALVVSFNWTILSRIAEWIFVFWTFGAQVLGVLCLDLGRLLPDCKTAPSYKPLWDLLNTLPSRVACTRVGREKGEEVEDVLPEAPGPDPLLPR